MEEIGPNKQEIQEIFRRLRNIPANKACFDCNSKNPTWASVTYGIFICIDCSAVHRSLGVHLSFVRSTQLDTSWTWSQLRNMQLGGNSNAATFFSQHNCSSTDAQQKYNSRAANLYREKLNQATSKYIKLHGNKIIFDGDDHGKLSTDKEMDFFDHIHQTSQSMETLQLDNSTRLTALDSTSANDGNTEGPNVLPSLSDDAPKSVSAPRKSTLGQRKPASKLGAKKVGLGAQKVKADFSEIEKEAQLMDQMKETLIDDAKREAENRALEEEKQLATMRLAYQDLSKQQKQREEKLKNLDPKKAEQVERLGMGIGIRSGVSHSAMSEIKTIEQEVPTSMSSKHLNKKQQDLFDDFEMLEPSYYSFQPSKNITSLDWDEDDNEEKKIVTKAPKFPSLDDEFKSSKSSRINNNNSRHTKGSTSTSIPSSSSFGDEAQKKFGNAKAISSDQYFDDSRDNDFERRTNLQRFDGQKSISSADYFGDGSERNRQQRSVSSIQSTLQSVDLDDVKESVRQGVTKVAGRLSNLANGMMSSLQEKYGY